MRGGIAHRQLLFSVLLLIVALSFHFLGFTSVPQEVIELKTVDINGNSVSLSAGNTNLLLFFNLSNTYDKMTLFYAAALDSKLKKHGLRIIGIAKGDSPGLDNFAQRSGILFPLVADKDYRIHEQFGVTQCCGATILTDKLKKKKFFLPKLLEAGNLRQLLEKETKGKIDYRQGRVKQDVFFVDKKIPDIPLTEAGTGEKVDFDSMDGQELVITFFSSLCGMCKTGKRLHTLIDIEEELNSSGQTDDLKFVLVFMGPFDMEDILEWEKRLPMPFEKYLTGYLFSKEEKYLTDPDKKNDPLTIVVDKERKVRFIEEAGIDEKRFQEVLLQFLRR